MRIYVILFYFLQKPLPFLYKDVLIRQYSNHVLYIAYLLFLVGLVFLIFSFLCCHIMCLYVPCCDVRYDFRIKNNVRFVFTSSCLQEVLFTLFVFVSLHSLCGAQHIIVCVFVLFSFVLCTLYTQCMLPVSLDCPFLSPLPYSLIFIYSSLICNYSLIFIYSSLIIQLFVKTRALVTLADFVYLFRSLGYITNNTDILALLFSIMITFKRKSEREIFVFYYCLVFSLY